MSKDPTRSSEPSLEKAPAAGFTVPRPIDVPGSTPPPNRKSLPAIDGAPRARISSIPPGGATSAEPSEARAIETTAIPGAPALPRVVVPPRPAGPPKPGKADSAKGTPAKIEAKVEANTAPASEQAPPSSVVVTPMRIIGIASPKSGSPVTQNRNAALPGSDWPTPVEVPVARRSVPPPVDNSVGDNDAEDDDEEAVPLRRLSTPPPAPDAMLPPSAVLPPAAVSPANAMLPPPSSSLPPLGAPPPPPPTHPPADLVPALPSMPDAVPATHPSGVPHISNVPPALAAQHSSVQPAVVRPKPPPPPLGAAAVEVEIELAPESDPLLESLDENDLTEVATSKPKRRRLPPPPPLRTSFGDAANEDTKRKAWWEEFFQEDYDLSTLPLDADQLEKEVSFIESMVAVQRGGAILDLGCGNGNNAVALAQRGYAMTGLDWSTAMLTRAGSRARAHSQPVEFVLGDMRELTFDQRFDAVVCWNASFGYFESERNLAVLRGVLQALKPGGCFLIDIPNRDFIVANEPAQNWFEGDGCVCMDDMRLDYITSRLLVKRTIMLDDGRNRECHYSMRLFSLHEFGRMLHETGFRVAQLSGSVSTPGAFFGSTSPRLILLLTKP